MRPDLKAAVAELRREGRIVEAPPKPVSLLQPQHVELLNLYSSGIRGDELAERLGVSYFAAQQRLKRLAERLKLSSVRDLKVWAVRNELGAVR
jgi:DNA-binding CsgD family transcriptional regulator